MATTDLLDRVAETVQDMDHLPQAVLDDWNEKGSTLEAAQELAAAYARDARYPRAFIAGILADELENLAEGAEDTQ